jgi:hypothetical protein
VHCPNSRTYTLDRPSSQQSLASMSHFRAAKQGWSEGLRQTLRAFEAGRLTAAEAMKRRTQAEEKPQLARRGPQSARRLLGRKQPQHVLLSETLLRLRFCSPVRKASKAKKATLQQTGPEFSSFRWPLATCMLRHGLASKSESHSDIVIIDVDGLPLPHLDACLKTRRLRFRPG